LWCKHTNFEQATRVPLLIRVPGEAGKVVEPAVELVDLFPTICEWAGVESPEGLEGESLLREEAGGYALSQYPRPGLMGYSLRSERFRYTAWFPWDVEAGAIQSAKPVAEELYDYERDPLETVSRIHQPEYAEPLSGLRDRLRGMIAVPK
jgi:iduronate 2-sulfatase